MSYRNVASPKRDDKIKERQNELIKHNKIIALAVRLAKNL